MPSSDLSGLVGLVTGGGSGIGLALAHALADAGVRVAVTDRDAASAEACSAGIVANGGSAIALELDVTSRTGWEAAVERIGAQWGPIDILCSNAGSNGCRLPLTEMPVDYMRWLFEVNVFGAVHGVQLTVPGMVQRGRGFVLLTGSMAGLSAGPTGADYCGSKHALLAIAEALRAEVNDAGVRVSYLCPAAVPSNLSQSTQNNLDPAIAALMPAGIEAGEAAKARAIAGSGGYVSAGHVANLALAALMRNQFLVPTHPAAGAGVRARYEQFECARAELEP